MKKVAAVLALSLMIGVSAKAGTITFTPLDGTDVFSNPDLGPTSIDFLVGLSGDFSFDRFTAIAQHIGVNGGPQVSFAYDPFFLFDPGDPFPQAVFNLSSVDPSSEFESSLLLNAVSTEAPPRNGRPLPWDSIGTLTISTTPETADGLYNIQTLGEIAFGDVEAAIGGATFNVVPEPATISLLALGALGLLRRRKTA